MLASMHKHMKWLMWTIVILVTVTFMFFGIYPADVGGGSAAKVGGEIITMDEFNRVYQNLYEMYRNSLKDKFNEAMIKEVKLQAINELVRDRLLIQEAERIGLSVGDQELQEAIMKEPAFLRDGVFDKKRYERTLNIYNMKPAQFEAKERGSLLRRKLEQLVHDGVGVNDDELAAAYQQYQKYQKQNPKAVKLGDFEKNRAGFRQAYLQRKQQEALSVYIKGLYDKTEIKISEKLRSS